MDIADINAMANTQRCASFVNSDLSSTGCDRHAPHIEYHPIVLYADNLAPGLINTRNSAAIAHGEVGQWSGYRLQQKNVLHFQRFFDREFYYDGI